MDGLRRQLPAFLAMGIVALMFGSQWPRSAASMSTERVVPAQPTAPPTTSVTPATTATPTGTPSSTPATTNAPTPTRCPGDYWTIRVHVFPDDVGGYDPETGEVGCDGNFTAADAMAAAYCKLDNAWVIVYPKDKPDEIMASYIITRREFDVDMWHTFALCVPPPYEARIMTPNMRCRRLCRHWPDTVVLEQSDFDKSMDKRYASVKWPFVSGWRGTETPVPTRLTPTRFPSPTRSATRVAPTFTVIPTDDPNPTTTPPVITATARPSDTPTPVATATPTPVATATPTPVATATAVSPPSIFLPYTAAGSQTR